MSSRRFSLGSFTVDEGGRLELQAPEMQSRLDFSWRGRPVAAQVHQDHLRLTMLMGRIPSSAVASARRPKAFALMNALPRLLPRGWSPALLADHQLRLAAEMPFSQPGTVTDLLVPMVRFLLELAPFLDLMEEEGIGVHA
jgi:hypothetical protein